MTNNRTVTEQGLKPRIHGRRNQRSGVILMLACFCMPVLMGMMGLAVDASVLYAIKTKLQMAVDGAALAGLRAMSLSQTSSSQTSLVTGVATTWFTANFAGNYLGASSTVLATPTLNNANSQHSVVVSATTQAPSYFMKYWNKGATTVGATGTAGRRDVNLMMVLDRSASMGSGAGSACASMISAAKQFTGMFTPGLDNIGLVAFAEAVQIVSSPTTSFQSVLGYSNSAGGGTGALDNISCVGGTNTSAAISLAWNELYKKQLPGAYNVVMLFTDGKPTAASFNMYVSAAADPTGNAHTAILDTSGCQDSTNKSKANGGNHITNPRNWIYSRQGGTSAPSGPGNQIDLGTNTYWNPFYGEIAAIYSDPGTSNFQGGSPIFVGPGTTPSTLENTQLNTNPEAPGCSFASSRMNVANDIAFVPPTDMFGRPTTGYVPIGTSNIQSAQRIAFNMNNVGSVVFNLADNAATWARDPRVGGTLINYTNGVPVAPATFFVIGLGSNGGVDHTLLQRIANDTNFVNVNNPNFTALAGPQGYYYYAPTPTDILSAFSKLGSSTLRLAQ